MGNEQSNSTEVAKVEFQNVNYCKSCTNIITVINAEFFEKEGTKDRYFLLQEEKTEAEKISETHENGSVNGLAVTITANGLEGDGECHLDLLCHNMRDKSRWFVHVHVGSNPRTRPMLCKHSDSVSCSVK